MRQPEHLPHRVTPSGSRQSASGYPLANHEPERVGDNPTLGELDVPDLQRPKYRPLRISNEFQDPEILHEDISPESVEIGCNLIPVGGPVPVRVSTIRPNLQGAGNTQRLRRNHAPTLTVLAEPNVVSSDNGAARRLPSQTPTQGNRPARLDRGRQRDPKHPALCVETLRRDLRQKGVPAKAAEYATRAWRESTVRTYDSRLARFNQWAADNACNPVEASLWEIAAFFTLLFEEGKAASTIRNYRSAIGAIHKGLPDGSTVGDNPELTKIIRGFFHTSGSTRTLPPTWSLNEVLSALAKPPYEPIRSLTRGPD
ncbi:hypothetical protein BSL78_22419 [Apostichopus japonicus]|uniref:Core-binding (CB) domain-containing protein n=1 Tax=Stichopus japonicus TaxID=307972 RepID=A0A2G8JYB3_STIJA|nr:hypothetical protein BSL78_22419 [Apostichopus japonicus]